MIAVENPRLSRLIENFLTFSRLERHRYRFVFAPSHAIGDRRVGGRRDSRARADDGDVRGRGRARLPPVLADAEALSHGAHQPAGERAQVHTGRQADRRAREPRWQRLGPVCGGGQRHRHSGSRAAADFPPLLSCGPAALQRDQRRRPRPQHRGPDCSRTPRDGQRAERARSGQHVHAACAVCAAREPRREPAARPAGRRRAGAGPRALGHAARQRVRRDGGRRRRARPRCRRSAARRI